MRLKLLMAISILAIMLVGCGETPAEGYCNMLGGEVKEVNYNGPLNASTHSLCELEHKICPVNQLYRGEC